MKEFDEWMRQQAAENPICVPESVDRKVEETLDSLPPRMKKKVVPLWRRTLAGAACFAVILVGVLPNMSVTYAQAVEDIPVLGALTRVFTLRNYTYYDGKHDLEADIPMVVDPENEEAADLINQDVSALTGAVIDRFYSELEVSTAEDHGAVHIQYETLTGTDRWFTMKIAVTEIAASSDSYEKYYHIDRTRGHYVTFGDLFAQEDYPALEAQILQQMEERMAEDPEQIFWTNRTGEAEHFTPLQDTQNFYFKEDGALVIVYDRYDVAPGYMGCPEFIIPETAYKQLLK